MSRFNITMQATITAKDADDAKAKLHDLIWRHYGVHCTSELDARLNVNIEPICPVVPEPGMVAKAWANIVDGV